MAQAREVSADPTRSFASPILNGWRQPRFAAGNLHLVNLAAYRGAAGFRRYLPRVALMSLLTPSGLSPPFAYWAFSLEETPQEAAGSFTGRDLKAEQLDRSRRIVPQGSWSWQAVALIIADVGQDSVRIWLETGSNFPPRDAQHPRRSEWRPTRAASGEPQVDGQKDQSIMGPPPERRAYQETRRFQSHDRNH